MMPINDDQIHDVEKCILEADPKAFITVSTVDRIIGNYYQKPLE